METGSLSEAAGQEAFASQIVLVSSPENAKQSSVWKPSLLLNVTVNTVEESEPVACAVQVSIPLLVP